MGTHIWPSAFGDLRVTLHEFSEKIFSVSSGARILTCVEMTFVQRQWDAMF